MLVTFLDDTVPFDGHSSNSRPLGGPQKAIAALAAAMAKRGHVVRVYNNCEFPVVVDDVSWRNIDECDAVRTDWLIAHRNPKLLGLVPDAERRALWLSAPARGLDNGESYSIVNQHKPVIVLQGLFHSSTVPPIYNSQRTALIIGGVGDLYREAAAMTPATPPKAVVTVHPRAGLGWLLNLWIEHVFPRVPWAELHVFSAILDRGQLGAAVPDDIRPILERATNAANQGVRIMRPLSDPDMVEAYRTARAHLYPGSENDVTCSTLAESQAVGLPAVVRALGAASERIRNGQTGYVAPDDEAFANLAVRLLDDGDTFRKLSDAARDSQRGRSWDKVTEEFERAFV